MRKRVALLDWDGTVSGRSASGILIELLINHNIIKDDGIVDARKKHRELYENNIISFDTLGRVLKMESIVLFQQNHSRS